MKPPPLPGSLIRTIVRTDTPEDAKSNAVRAPLRLIQDLREQVARLTAERDESRESRQRAVDECHENINALREALAERDMARAEVEMLRGVGCEEDGDGPCGVCLKCARRERDRALALLRKTRAAVQQLSDDFSGGAAYWRDVLAEIDALLETDQ